MDFFLAEKTEKQKNRKQKTTLVFLERGVSFPLFFFGGVCGCASWTFTVACKKKGKEIRRFSTGVLIFVRCFSFVVSLVCRVCGF